MNQYQIKSLANLCMDLGKAWYLVGLTSLTGIVETVSSRGILILTSVVGGTAFIVVGLWMGKEVAE